MRPFLLHLLVLALGLSLPSCTCSPATAVPITMRVLNNTSSPFYVDGTKGKQGLTVQRDVGGQLFGFDDLACNCTFCTNVCSVACSCPATPSLVQRVDPSSSVERSWDGVVQVADQTTCSSSGCLQQENAPTNETFTLQLCFTTQKPAGTFNDAGVVAGSFDTASQVCTTKQFKLQDGIVTIGPTPGSSCTTSADCKGTNELCFAGTCTSGCPSNDFPTDPTYLVYVASPDNMGFFTQATRSTGNQFTGAGTLTSVVYSGSSLELSLSRPGAGAELLTGKITVQLPPSLGPPLRAGTPVSVTLVDDGKSRPNRALVVRSDAGILFAADMAQNASNLTATDLAPFTLTEGQTPIGCKQDDCGRFLYFEKQLTVGAVSATVEPGTPTTFTLGADAYTFLSVSDGAYASTHCDVAQIRPWALWHQ